MLVIELGILFMCMKNLSIHPIYSILFCVVIGAMLIKTRLKLQSYGGVKASLIRFKYPLMWVSIILQIILVVASGFICYDQYLSKEARTLSSEMSASWDIVQEETGVGNWAVSLLPKESAKLTKLSMSTIELAKNAMIELSNYQRESGDYTETELLEIEAIAQRYKDKATNIMVEIKQAQKEAKVIICILIVCEVIEILVRILQRKVYKTVKGIKSSPMNKSERVFILTFVASVLSIIVVDNIIFKILIIWVVCAVLILHVYLRTKRN